MTRSEFDRRTLLATVAGATAPALAGCSGSSYDESDFRTVSQTVDYSSASECAEMRIELEYTGDGEVDGEVEFDTRLLDGGGDPVSDWHRSTADFSQFAPADRAETGQVWCQERGASDEIERATDVGWRLRE